METPICQHCHEHPVSKSRGLCWRCWFTPGIKEKYTIEECYAHRGNGLSPSHGKKLPQRPTQAQPGSAKKIQVMADRAAKGLALHHPLDKGARDFDWEDLPELLLANISAQEED
jgi:hypothetical protein